MTSQPAPVGRAPLGGEERRDPGPGEGGGEQVAVRDRRHPRARGARPAAHPLGPRSPAAVRSRADEPVVDGQPGPSADRRGAGDPAPERLGSFCPGGRVGRRPDAEPRRDPADLGRRPAAEPTDGRTIAGAGGRGAGRPAVDAVVGERDGLPAADGQRVGRAIEDPRDRSVGPDLQDAVVVGHQRRAGGVQRQRARPLGQSGRHREAVAGVGRAVGVVIGGVIGRHRGPRAGTAGPPSPSPRRPRTPRRAGGRGRRARPAGTPCRRRGRAPEEVAIQTPVAPAASASRARSRRRQTTPRAAGGRAPRLPAPPRPPACCRRRGARRRGAPRRRRVRPAGSDASGRGGAVNPAQRATAPPVGVEGQDLAAAEHEDPGLAALLGARDPIDGTAGDRPAELACRGDARRAGGQRRHERDDEREDGRSRGRQSVHARTSSSERALRLRDPRDPSAGACYTSGDVGEDSGRQGARRAHQGRAGPDGDRAPGPRRRARAGGRAGG